MVVNDSPRWGPRPVGDNFEISSRDGSVHDKAVNLGKQETQNKGQVISQD